MKKLGKELKMMQMYKNILKNIPMYLFSMANSFKVSKVIQMYPIQY